MPATRHTLQFKVSLLHMSPPVWRRIVVAEDDTFWQLHVAIQDAMGWHDCHLHLFRFSDPGREIEIGLPVEQPAEVAPSWLVPIKNVFNLADRAGRYLYDFGDGWEHRIQLEVIRPLEKDEVLPRCTGGRRACPPENSGGPHCFSQVVLPALTTPDHPDHESTVERFGEFDSSAFDKSAVRFDDPEQRLDRLR